MSSNNRKITAKEIKLALALYHKDKPTYFITECKTCSTMFPDPRGLMIFDGLAITKSYARPNIIGYEIKVSRADFLNDNKWHLYLQYCNEFYFVVPIGLVSKNEVPNNVGLIYYNPNKLSIRTVKKALHRTIEKPIGIYEYIIFSRLEQDRLPFYNTRTEYCRDYIDDIQYKKDIGKVLGTKLAQQVQELTDKISSLQNVDAKLNELKTLKEFLVHRNVINNRDLNDIDKIVEKLDLHLYSFGSANKDEIDSAINTLNSGLIKLKSLVGYKY